MVGPWVQLNLHIPARAGRRSSRSHRSVRPALHRDRLFWRRARCWASDRSIWLAQAAARTPAASAQTGLDVEDADAAGVVCCKNSFLALEGARPVLMQI